jgi:hypothetical protein
MDCCRQAFGHQEGNTARMFADYCLEGRDDNLAFGAGSQLFLRTF